MTAALKRCQRMMPSVNVFRCHRLRHLLRRLFQLPLHTLHLRRRQVRSRSRLTCKGTVSLCRDFHDMKKIANSSWSALGRLRTVFVNTSRVCCCIHISEVAAGIYSARENETWSWSSKNLHLHGKVRFLQDAPCFAIEFEECRILLPETRTHSQRTSRFQRQFKGCSVFIWDLCFLGFARIEQTWAVVRLLVFRSYWSLRRGALWSVNSFIKKVTAWLCLCGSSQLDSVFAELYSMHMCEHVRPFLTHCCIHSDWNSSELTQEFCFVLSWMRSFQIKLGDKTDIHDWVLNLELMKSLRLAQLSQEASLEASPNPFWNKETANAEDFPVDVTKHSPDLHPSDVSHWRARCRHLSRSKNAVLDGHHGASRGHLDTTTWADQTESVISSRIDYFWTIDILQWSCQICPLRRYRDWDCNAMIAEKYQRQYIYSHICLPLYIYTMIYTRKLRNTKEKIMENFVLSIYIT